MHNSGIIWNLFKILETVECLQETLREISSAAELRKPKRNER
jgi:hypothetical protein